MTKVRVLLWILIAWPLPALIAGALGWKGIWGSGSALADYLIPLPVAGGVLHVPSFVCAGVAMLLLPNLGPAGAVRLRALLIGVALAGVLWLLNLHDLWLAQQTGMKFSGRLWQDNPLGLFLVSDALLFTTGASLRWLPGDGGCFSDHHNFSERLAQAVSARSQDEPAELRRYFAARELCAKEKFAAVPAGRGLQATSAFVCEGLPRRRDELLLKFPDDPRLRDAAQ